MKLLSLSPVKQKLLLVVLLAIVVLAASYWLVVKPLHVKTDNLRQQLQAESSNMQKVQQFINNHPDIDVDFQVVADDIKLLDTLLPQDEQIGIVLADWERLARLSGVQLQRVQPMTPVQRDKYTELTVNVNVKGGFIQVLTYIKGLEDSRRFTAVRQFGVRYGGQTGKQATQLEAALLVSVFSQKR